jgi:hypothetical protein
MIFTLNIQNSPPVGYYMNMKLDWNGVNLFDTYLQAKIVQEQITVTNQNLFVTNGSIYFRTPEPNINLSSIFDNNEDFKNIILNTGRFPDGIYLFTLRAVNDPQEQILISNVETFSLEIRNANAIYLLSPGVQLGGMIPTINNLPINFLWNSNLIGINNIVPGLGTFTLTIREFDQVGDIQLDNIDNGQVFRQITDLIGSNYSEFIPFESGKYYAWQISTPLADPSITNPLDQPTLQSPWIVFKYVVEGSAAGTTPEDEIVIILTNLNDPQVNGTLNDEFKPTGNVYVDDQLFSGMGALQQLQRLSGKVIKSISVSDQ